MANINVDIDEAACAKIMRRYKLTSKEEAINLVLRKVAAEPSPFTPPAKPPLTAEEIRALRGIGWDLDLDALRSGCCRHEHSG